MSGPGVVYLDMVDDLYHRREHDRLEAYVSSDYVVVDPYFERGVGPHGLRVFHSSLAAELEDLHYDTAELLDNGKAIAARFVVTARRSGRDVALRGLSINHSQGGKLSAGWIVADYRAIDRHTNAPVPPAALERWDGNPITSAPRGSNLATYLELVDALYVRRDPVAAAAVLHPRYLCHDPFLPRGPSGVSQIDVHRKVLARLRSSDYRVLDAIEVGDRLATRFLVRGVDTDGNPVAVPGISINHFEEGKIRRGWVQCRYGGFL
jgi:hypothetical protein